VPNIVEIGQHMYTLHSKMNNLVRNIRYISYLQQAVQCMETRLNMLCATLSVLFLLSAPATVA